MLSLSLLRVWVSVVPLYKRKLVRLSEWCYNYYLVFFFCCCWLLLFAVLNVITFIFIIIFALIQFCTWTSCVCVFVCVLTLKTCSSSCCYRMARCLLSFLFSIYNRLTECPIFDKNLNQCEHLSYTITWRNLLNSSSMFVCSSLITLRLYFIVVLVLRAVVTVLSLSTVTTATDPTQAAKFYQICDWWKHCNYLLTCCCFVTSLMCRMSFFVTQRNFTSTVCC